MTKKLFLSFPVFILLAFSHLAGQSSGQKEKTNKIYIAFHWHMHQPIYMPYESAVQTQQSNAYSFSLYDVFTSRTGPYTDWPKNAVQKGISANMGHFGAQVSFSGSLVENLNNLSTAGVGFSNWKTHWNSIITQKTTLNNPRIDLVGFGYHHPLMGLLDRQDIRKSIQDHKAVFQTNFPNYTYSKGIFPPENAFSVRMIPALVAEGLQWVLVDNFNFERASEGCPTGDGTGVLKPNQADILNPNPHDWVSLNGLWCPSPVSARWAHQPKYVQYVDPNTGQTSRIIAVPASRYLGNEDGRGGFGALNYDYVMSQLESYNTDPEHPILIVLHHDGDNFGGGSEGYYGPNFQNFVNWLGENSSRFECTTIQDYLDRFPPSTIDVIHVQDGSWVGADSGDPEFKKWNGDPGNYQGTANYSPDRNSWGIVTAAKNIVATAQQVNPTSQHTTNAWKYYLNSQTSCYWYWDGTEMWDSHPARACNLAVSSAMNVLGGTINDQTPPSIYVPQREPYNPGAVEWNSVGVMPSDFTVWTYVYDFSGLQSVKLKYRTVEAGVHTATSTSTRTYAGGAGVGAWQEISMTGVTNPSITNPQPTYKAQQYSAQITGLQSVLVNYYVEAVDANGNIAKSDIQHVWIGDGSGSGGGSTVSWEPQDPNLNEVITITATNAIAGSKLHWGVTVNGMQWVAPIQAYWPEGTVAFDGQAVQTPFVQVGESYQVQIGPFNNAQQVVEKVNFVIKINDNTWDNNNGQDYHIQINNNPGDNPIGSNGTVSTPINQNLTFAPSNFYFVGMGGATFNGIKIISSVNAGALEYSVAAVVANVDYPDVSLLVFRPALGASGSPYTSFTFKVKDSEGRYSDATYTMTINVVSANPTGANAAINLTIDQQYTFSVSNFPFSSPVGALFGGVVVQTLPQKGALLYNGSPVTQGMECPTVSQLTYSPLSGESGVPYTSFTFKVRDDQGRVSQSDYTLTINVVSSIPDGVSWIPQDPTQNDMVTVFVKGDASMSSESRLHWGVNGWQQPIADYRPVGSTLHNGTGPAIQTPFENGGDYWYINLGPFNSTQTVSMLDFVLFYGGNNWNNNGGADWHVAVNNVVSVPESQKKGRIEVFPNPVHDYTTIRINDNEYSKYNVELTDLTGKVILRAQFNGGEIHILHRNNLLSGVYLLQFRCLTDRTMETHKIVLK